MAMTVAGSNSLASSGVTPSRITRRPKLPKILTDDSLNFADLDVNHLNSTDYQNKGTELLDSLLHRLLDAKLACVFSTVGNRN